MLSFKADPVSHLVLTFGDCLHNVVEGLKGCSSVFFNQLMSCLYHFAVGDKQGFFHCAWAVPQ